MRTEFKTTWWSIDLSESWQGRNDPECSTFESELRYGALQLSSAWNMERDATDVDLMYFLRQFVPVGMPYQPIQVGEFRGLYAELTFEGSFWRYWFLRDGNLAVLATYNCNEGHQHQEDEAVDEMLATLRRVAG